MSSKWPARKLDLLVILKFTDLRLAHFDRESRVVMYSCPDNLRQISNKFDFNTIKLFYFYSDLHRAQESRSFNQVQ